MTPREDLWLHLNIGALIYAGHLRLFSYLCLVLGLGPGVGIGVLIWDMSSMLARGAAGPVSHPSLVILQTADLINAKYCPSGGRLNAS